MNNSNRSPVIIQFESDSFYQINLDLILSNIGYSIAAKASNIEEARSLVDKIQKKILVPDVAIVTDYLERDWNDGSKIAAKLREVKPDIKVIGYSIIKEKPEWADAYGIKSGLDNEQTIVNALRQVLNIELKFTGEEVEGD